MPAFGNAQKPAIPDSSGKFIYELLSSVEAQGFDDSDIGIFDLAGDLATNLTNSPDIWETYPSWSSDGRQIVYVSLQRGGFDLEAQAVLPDIYSINVTTQPLVYASGYRLLSGHDSSCAFEPRAV
jgi:Tol biopolymer transport system component